MSKSVQGLLQHCKKAVKNNVQYVYGAKMQILTRQQILNLQNMYGKNYVWDSDLKKAGKMCCDCSGLISSYTGVVRNSTNYCNTATKTVSISELKKNWKKYIGWGLWLKGHIGVVSDTIGYYYALDGSARNAVHLPLNKNSWVKAIKLKDIDYTNYTTEVKKMTYAEAIEKLHKSGVVSTPDYWNNAVKCVKNLDALIINMAKKL